MSEGSSDGYKDQGYMITYTSEQKCAANPSKKMVIRFMAVCDKDGTPFTEWSLKTATDCRRTLIHYGPEACAIYNYTDLMSFSYFTAFINLVLGCFIAFQGYNYLRIVTIALFIYGGIGVCFGTAYTLGIIVLGQSEIWALLLTFLVGLLGGFAAARQVPIWLGNDGVHITAGAWLGLVIAYLILCPINTWLSNWGISILLATSMIGAAKSFSNW